MAHASPHGAADGLSFFSISTSHGRSTSCLNCKSACGSRLRAAAGTLDRSALGDESSICPSSSSGMGAASQGYYWQCLANWRNFGRLASSPRVQPNGTNKQHDIVLSLMHKIRQRDTQLSIRRCDSTRDVVTPATAPSNHRTSRHGRPRGNSR